MGLLNLFFLSFVAFFHFVELGFFDLLFECFDFPFEGFGLHVLSQSFTFLLLGDEFIAGLGEKYTIFWMLSVSTFGRDTLLGFLVVVGRLNLDDPALICLQYKI